MAHCLALCLHVASLLRLTAGHHVALVLPPASPAGAMLPVACALIDAGHNVSILAWDEPAEKIRPMIPGARVIGVGPLVRPDVSANMPTLLSIPYEVMSFALGVLLNVFDVIIGAPLAEAALPILKELKPDVICVTNIIPSLYALGEALDVPVVGLGFAAPWLLTMSLDMPWSLQPAMGSFYSYEEIIASPGLMVLNTLVRMQHILMRSTVGVLVTNIIRWKLGVKRLVFSPHDPLIENPMVIPSLPEFSAGQPNFATTNAVWVGMYDHPTLDGGSLGKSAQHHEIMKWLDEHAERKQSVLYCAFGSEIELTLEWAQRLVSALGSIPVLWVLKKTPAGLASPPPNVFVTPWSPQKAVLGHPAVTAFFSHGGGNSIRESMAAGVPLIIMPFFGDQPMNAMIHAKLGVAIKVHKQHFDSLSFAAHFKEISSEKFQRRAAEIKALNDKRVSLPRAVEVVENAASRRFPMTMTQAPTPLAFVPIAVLFMAFSFARACCVRCCCCCRCCRRAVLPKAAHAKVD